MSAPKRSVNAMPQDIAAELADRGLRGAYDERPAYQRNDYLGWIARARGAKTRRSRIDQMLEELEAGHGYMHMKWKPPAEPR